MYNFDELLCRDSNQSPTKHVTLTSQVNSRVALHLNDNQKYNLLPRTKKIHQGNQNTFPKMNKNTSKTEF